MTLDPTFPRKDVDYMQRERMRNQEQQKDDAEWGKRGDRDGSPNTDDPLKQPQNVQRERPEDREPRQSER